ncbi:MAG: rod shape-determining protein, partial [Caldilineaceae bacterium]|nr:rod shape-determining protein [Caldilineaceae bacterium]
MATAILYRQAKDWIIGDKALEEFGDADEHERKAYTIRTQFKPDIAHGEEAREYSSDFLEGLLRDAARNHIDLMPSEREVIFGVPSEADENYHQALAMIAAKSGFGQIKLVDEPKGAIYFHVERKDITPKEALQGALVIDFGGGTCDFAVVVRGEILHSWGDMNLGGRLFDDLFYQWFIEQNPDSLEDMQAEHAEFFVLWFQCRKIKEKFSQAMTMDRSTRFRKAVGEFGRLQDVTWDGFMKRARLYQPSETFTRYMNQVNPLAVNRFATGEPVDLLEWFRYTLRNGLQHERVRNQRLGCIVLTGGSSSWSFVPEIVMEEMANFNSHPRLIRSDRPYATISEGLALIPSLQRRFVAVQKALRDGVPGFIKEEINPLIDRRMKDAAERIADMVTASLFDQRIRPILNEFRETGGSVASLKRRIAEQAVAFEPQVASIVETEIGQVFAGLPLHIFELMTQWFKKHDLLIDDQLVSDKLGKKVDGQLNVNDINIYSEIEAIIGVISVSVITIIVAGISGGSGLALVATGPLGL